MRGLQIVGCCGLIARGVLIAGCWDGNQKPKMGGTTGLPTLHIRRAGLFSNSIRLGQPRVPSTMPEARAMGFTVTTEYM